MLNPLSLIIPFRKYYAYTSRSKSSILRSLGFISSDLGTENIKCTVDGDSFKIRRTQKPGIHFHINTFRFVVVAYGKVSEHGEETEIAVTLRMCTSAIVLFASILFVSIFTFIFSLLGIDDSVNPTTCLLFALTVEAIMQTTFAIYSKGIMTELERVI